MNGKYIYILIVALLIGIQVNAQFQPERMPSGRSVEGNSGYEPGNENPTDKDQKDKAKKKKPSVPSVIKVWQMDNQGARIKPSELDTLLTFYHIYQPFEQRSISNTFVGNTGGAYESNDFFNRTFNSDFYFANFFDAYWLMPGQIQYFNTTTPYSVLDYTQSDNKDTKNETRFNVFHSQNVNKKFNFEFIYNQTKSQGQFARQVTKFHNIGLVTSYVSDKFVSHTNLIFNRNQAQENGGVVLDPGGKLTDNKTEDFIVRLEGEQARMQNNNFFTTNEYRLGKTIKADSADYVVDAFIPRVGFIHSFEYSTNRRSFMSDIRDSAFFANTFNDTIKADSTTYKRMTNIFQIKFYEAPDRKYTFGKRAYIGNDQLWYKFSDPLGYFPRKQTNMFVGGGIFRNEGKFWQWEADGRIYLTGYRAGQTELSGSINKPLRIGRDTTSLRIQGSVKSLKPEYYDQYFYSNHFQWLNNFSNINEVRLGGTIRSQEYHASVGANYALIGNYIYNNEQAMPTQASGELMVLSAYANKDFESRHWLIRTQLLAQKASNEDYIHLPALAGFVSINYLTLWSKVMYTQLGIDTRYNTSFYADAYQPGTSRFYLQNQQKIGNYPYVDLHVNLKLKRTRFFFRMMNVGSGLLGSNYFSAPDYPYYRRTYRIGLAWSFYD